MKCCQSFDAIPFQQLPDHIFTKDLWLDQLGAPLHGKSALIATVQPNAVLPECFGSPSRLREIAVASGTIRSKYTRRHSLYQSLHMMGSRAVSRPLSDSMHAYAGRLFSAHIASRKSVKFDDGGHCKLESLIAVWQLVAASYTGCMHMAPCAYAAC